MAHYTLFIFKLEREKNKKGKEETGRFNKRCEFDFISLAWPRRSTQRQLLGCERAGIVPDGWHTFNTAADQKKSANFQTSSHSFLA